MRGKQQSGKSINPEQVVYTNNRGVMEIREIITGESRKSNDRDK